MQDLLRTIKELKDSEVGTLVKTRLREFKNNKDWFSELCFCLMTANWKAEESIKIQGELCKEGFCSWDEKKLAKFLKQKGHRFWPQRAERIVLVRQYKDIKLILKKEKEPREWLVKNIKGLGYKESSHLLRNVGYENYAILDRHIINILSETKIIERPKTLTKNKYLAIEQKLQTIADKLKISQAELDLYLWCIKTGKVLK
ncbi:MAG: N-glycosylase/DNA lyase [Nanoarchaeota archaeon]